MTIVDVLSLACVGLGLCFFVAGTIGLLRFPDVHCRLHALTKADNLGLGLVAVGVLIGRADVYSVLKLGMIWILVVFSSATACFMIAAAARRSAASCDRGEEGT